MTDDRAVAWIVLLVDASTTPAHLVGACVSPVPDPIPPPEVERAERVAVLCAEGESYADAASAARALLAAPRWRWIWTLPTLGPGFRHEWETGDDGRATCRKCRQARGSRVVETWRLGASTCLVSHAGRCASCGELGAIVAGSTRCTSCEIEAAETRPAPADHATETEAAPADTNPPNNVRPSARRRRSA